MFSPEILFLFGTIQALSPYFFWLNWGVNDSYNYEITSLPIIIWVVGFLCFWLGTRFLKVKKSILTHPIKNWNLRRVKFATIITVLIIIFQIILSVRTYGVLPLFGYATGSLDVSIANDLQRESGFGQFGILTVTLFALNSLLLILIIKGFEINQKLRFTFAIALIVEIFGGLISGKRQGLFITLVYIICGLTIHYGHPIKPLLKFFGLPKNLFFRLILGLLFCGILTWLVGFLSSLRVGDQVERSGFDEIFTYLQLPLINLEAQCEQVGFGPFKYNFIYPFLNLIPNKLSDHLVPSLNDLPYRPELTIGAGFYGTLHWNLGLPGICLGAFISGFVSKLSYQRACYGKIFPLLVYCQISWTLLSAHTYNHFLNLVFIPLPAISFLLLCNLLDSHQKSTYH